MPVAPQHRSLILIYERSSDDVEAYAYALDEHGDFTPALAETIAEKDEVRVTALLYTATLVELALAPGRLELVAAGRPLPAADVLTAATIQHGEASTWAALDHLESAADALRIQALGSCAGFDITSIPLASGSVPLFIVRVKEQGVLVGTREMELFYVEPGGATRLEAPLARDGTNLPFYNAYLEENGSIWLGSVVGGIWRGSLLPAGCDISANPCRKLEAREAGILTSADEVLWVTGPAHGTAGVIYAMAEDGSMERFDGFMWTRIHNLTGAPESTYSEAIDYVSDDEAIAGSQREGAITRYRSGEILREPLPPAGAFQRQVFALKQVAGMGGVAGDDGGRVAIDRGHPHAWIDLQVATSTAAVRAIVPYRGGMVWLGEDGRVFQYVPGLGACPPIAAASTSVRDETRRMAVVGADLAVAELGPPLAVRWLRRR